MEDFSALNFGPQIQIFVCFDSYVATIVSYIIDLL